MTNGMPVGKMLDLFAKLARRRWYTPERLAQLDEVQRLGGVAITERNNLIHSLWILPDLEGDAVTRLLKKDKTRPEYRQPEVVTPELVAGLKEQIERANGALKALVADLLFLIDFEPSRADQRRAMLR